MSEVNKPETVASKGSSSPKDRLKNVSDYSGAINRMLFLWGLIAFCAYSVKAGRITFFQFDYLLDFYGYFSIVSVAIYAAIVLFLLVKELIVYTFSVSLAVLPLMSEQIWRETNPKVRVKWTVLTIFFSLMLAGLSLASLKFSFLLLR